jgi:tol-pal system protein YbgF
MKDTNCRCGQHSLLQYIYCRRSVFTNPVLVSLAVLVTAGLWVTQTVEAREPAPVIEAAGQPAPNSLEKRLEVVEKRLDSQAMMEVMTRLDKMQQEMQNLVGQIEVINHDIDSIKKRQRDLYVDIDRRITQVEQKAAELAKSQSAIAPAMAGTASGTATMTQGMPTASPSAGTPSMPAPGVAQHGASGTAVASVSPQSSQLQRDAYDRAFNLLKDGRYELAIASFKAYLETYPAAEYAANAQYWLGEANYAQHKYKVALEEFNKVLDNYPKSAKLPDAMLKMGFSYQELNKPDDAQAVFSNIVSMFPDTTAARLAKKRLQDLKRH